MASQEPAIQALQQQRLLLQLEYNAEKETFRQQTEQVGIERKVKPVKVTRSYYNSLNQLAVEVVRSTDTDIEHCFEFGKPVQFFSIEISDTSQSKDSSKKNIRYFRYTATVSYADGDRMVITVPDNISILDLQNTEKLGVQLSFDETSYRLMMEAIDRAIRGKGRIGYLRDLFYSRQKPETFVFPPMHFPYLNPTQEVLSIWYCEPRM